MGMLRGSADEVVALNSTAFAEGGSRLLKRGMARADIQLVRRAVATFEAVLAANPPGDANHAGASANLAGALVNAFELTGDVSALERAIGLLSAAEPDSRLLGAREGDFWSVSGHALLRDAERTNLPATIEKAVSARRRALDLTAPDEASHAARLTDLGSVLSVQFRVTGSASALTEARFLHERAVQLTAVGDPDLPGRLSNLGTCLNEVAQLTSDVDVLKRAVEVQREAVEKCEPNNFYYPMLVANLGISLLHLYQETADRAALKDAVQLQRMAAEGTPKGHVERNPRITNLAVALQSHYEQTGDLDAMDEAIEFFKEAIDTTPPQHANRFRYLHGLASALMRLAERTGDLSAVDDAIRMWEVVTVGTPDGHPSKPGRLSALATARHLQFLADPADTAPLKSGIEILRDARTLVSPGHAQYAMLATNLGALLLSLFDHTGAEDALDEAIALSRDAADAAPPGHSEQGMLRSNLGVGLVHRARLSDDADDAREAAALLESALELISPDDPGRAQTLFAQGSAYARAFELGDSQALLSGLTAFRDAAAMESAPTAMRIHAGREGGRLAASGQQFGEALAEFGNAVRLLEEAAWSGLGRGDQQRLLAELSGLPMDAAAMAIENNCPETAVELLERGRGVLLARQIEAPSLHAQLLSRAPDIADRLASVQKAIDQADRDSASPHAPDATGPPRDLAARRNRLARQRSMIMEEFRSRPDLADLHSYARMDLLLASAARGPVVIVNVSEYRCDALIVWVGRVHAVRLPGLTRQAAADQVDRLLDAADKAERQGVDQVLGWTWDVIVKPVLAALGLTEPVAPGQEAHLWWCATGLAAFLPLHAAGKYQENYASHGALDLVVSSYTPTLRILTQLRQREPTGPSARSGPLIVAMPQTSGMADLENTQREAEELASRFTVHERLTGSSATRGTVAAAMPQHPWVHFACHGSQNPLSPDDAALHLYDGPLAIPQIMNLGLPALKFAYLSACETNLGSTTVPDEAITLASALQMAGYQHVIATLWQVSDQTAVDIARHLYDHMTTTQRDGTLEIEADKAASALRKAVLIVRDEAPWLSALNWAPYVHTGP